MKSYAKHSISKEEIKEVVNQLKIGSLSRGPIIKKFEKELGSYLSSYAVTCSSGSSALEIALRTAGIGIGDEVIVPNISWSATATSVSMVGATPVFCDISKDYPNISFKDFEKNISNRVKAVIPVHFGGVSVNLKKLAKICSPKNIIIIEDACHAFGGRYEDDSLIGSSKLSYAACFSFHPAKSITTGEGGLLSTKNKSVYKKILSIRSSGINRKIENGFQKYLYDCVDLGSNFHMTTLSAAIGICQLKKVNKFILKRKILWQRYYDNLKKLSSFRLFHHKKNSSFNLCLGFVKQRKKLTQLLIKNNIGVSFHYPEIRLLSIYKKKLKPSINTKNKFPNSYNYTKNAITLPLYPDLKIKEIDFISNLIISFYKNK